MPKAYVAMRDAFKAEGLSDKQAKAKAAAIYNSKHKEHPVTNKEESVMTRLTRADIRKLLENDARFTRPVGVGKSGKGDTGRGEGWAALDAEVRKAVAKQSGEKQSKLTYTRVGPSGGREVSTTGEADVFDIPKIFKGATGGHATDASGKIVYRHTKRHESVKTYYRQLKESWWCGTEELVQPSNEDPTYKRYADIMRGLDAARTLGSKSIRTAGRVGGKAVEVINPTLGKAIKAGGEFQANIVKPGKLRDWVGEDTMTGDIGSIAMPFVAPGGDDPEEKKRRRRRKLGVVLAAATGSVQGTGN